MSNVGSKKGGGGLVNSSLLSFRRLERARSLTQGTPSSDNDPFLARHGGASFECRLCLTWHPTESSYLTHTHGRKHRESLAKRQRLKSGREEGSSAGPTSMASSIHRQPKIGRPGYEIVKIRTDGVEPQVGLLLNIKYPRIADGKAPRYRFMSTFEQHVEKKSPNYQYIVLAADPYESIAIKVPSRPIDSNSVWTYFHRDTGEFYLQFLWPPSVPR